MTRCESCPVRSGLPCPSPGRYCDDLTDARRTQLVAISEARATVAPKPVTPLVLRIHNNTHSGYGQHGTHYAKGLAATAPVQLVEIDRHYLTPLDPWVQARLVPDDGRPAVVFSVPSRDIRQGDILATMWEVDRIDPESVRNCNKAACVVVTCDQVARWFRDSGVAVPIRVAPLGLDTSVFHPSRPEPANKVVYGCAARTSHGGLRKGLDDTFAAFSAAFPARENVELRVKVWSDCEVPETDDPRIKLDRRSLSDHQVAEWLSDLSVFVTASRGEGWGFWAQQAMAVGRPVIGPLWGGHTAFADGTSFWPVDFDLEQVPDGTPYYGDYGARWCVPRQRSLVEKLRLSYRDGMGRLRKGEHGAYRAGEFTWDHATGELRKVLEEFGFVGPRPPAPAVTQQVAGCGPCGKSKGPMRVRR